MAADETSNNGTPNDKPAETPTTGQRQFRRKLTPFLAQEMLYDYATEQLDPDRRYAVDEYLKNDKESQRELTGIRQALEYTALLAQTSLNLEIVEQLQESENAISLGRRYSSWKEWPEALRWSITAVGISAVVAMIVAILPWNKFNEWRNRPAATTEVAQNQEAAEEPNEPATNEAAPTQDPAEEGSGDEVADVEAPPAGTQKAPPGVGSVAGSAATAPVPAPAPQAQPAKPTAAPPTNVAANEANEESAPATSSDKKPKGFVYRAFMTLPDLETVGPKITDELTALGAIKAGEVELGWKRGKGRYYHFSMPEANEEKALERLRAYGPVRISKDPHPRVMPAGQVRFILWVDAA